MGTRGLYGVVVDGEVKATYNHWDSYPSGLGCDIAEIIPKIDAEKARAMQLVDEEIPPTAEQKERLMGFADLSVSNQSLDDWYCLMRNAQGDLLANLECGYMIDSLEFAKDSLFCEWGYLVNLDTETLEVYKGFIEEGEEVKGRFAEVERDRPAHREGRTNYEPITLIAELPLSAEVEKIKNFLRETEKRFHDE